MSSNPEQRIEQLEAKIRELERQNTQQKAILDTEAKAAKWSASRLLRIIFSGSLVDALQDWFETKWWQSGELPAGETAKVLDALAKRYVIRIGWIGVLALIPTVLTLFFLGQQNRLIQEQIQKQSTASTEQNEILRDQIQEQATASAEQNQLVRDQIEQQAQLNDINRRAQLLSTIYDRTDCEEPNKEDCPLRASPRARAEAANAFAEIERLAGRQPDLSNIDISQANFSRIVLTQTNLSNANMISTTLSRADLRGAILFGADLRGADLFEADLSGANLRASLLVEADLRETDLSHATLFGAILFGTDLSGADLSGVDLSNTLYNSEQYQFPSEPIFRATRWPDGFDHASAGAIDLSKLDVDTLILDALDTLDLDVESE